MKRFFYVDDSGKRKGPYTIEELKNHYLFEDTLVWTDGMEKWTIASRVYDLKGILYKAPPPLNLIDTGEIESVEIGSQIWMRKNLDVSNFCNGDPIPHAESEEDWIIAGNEEQPAWCFYNNDPEMEQYYGRLYNWFAVSDPRSLAPEGWHIPSDDEWIELVKYIESQGYPNLDDETRGAGNALKYLSPVNSPKDNLYKTSPILQWELNKVNPVFEDFGFSALPCGYRDSWGDFANYRTDGYWWSSKEISLSNAWNIHLGQNCGTVNCDHQFKSFGFSVRCLRD